MITAKDTVAEDARRGEWPPADLHARGLVDEIGVRVVSHAGPVMHRWFGARGGDRFGILMYHRIADNVARVPKPTLNVTPVQFREQIAGLLGRGYVIWPLSKVLDFHARGWKIMPWVTVLTFDDGFAGVFHHAWPVLSELKVPATVFLNTAYLDGEVPFPFDAWAHRHRQRIPATAFRPLTAEQCREMAASGLVQFGAHTHTHQDFRGRASDFRRDLETNLAALAELAAPARVPFAFPYGSPDLGFAAEDLREAARQAGVACGLTTESMLVGGGLDPYRWGRLNVFAWDTSATLAAKLAGWYSWAPQLKRQLRQIVPGGTERGPKNGAGSRPPQQAPRPEPTPAPQETAARDGDEETHPATLAEAAVAERDGGPDPGPATPADPEKSGLRSFGADYVSVIVPTFNRAEWLGDALKSLLAQQTGGAFCFDIHVVDNGSTDDTQRVVSEIASTAPVPVHYHWQRQPGDAPTRNCGVARSRGRWLAFFDDDQLAEPTWLAELWRVARARGAYVVGGAVHLHLPAAQLARLGPLCRRALRETRLYDRVRPYRHRHLPGTGNALVSRAVFDDVGDFDESMLRGGSDSDFFTRARQRGYRLWYAPRAVIRHRVAPGRLSTDFFRWDALSGGAEHANYFDYRRGGVPVLLALCAARLLQAAVVHAPLLAWAWLRRDPGGVLGRRTQLWRAEGYLRRTLAIIAPRRFAQSRFFSSLDLRHGRTLCR